LRLSRIGERRLRRNEANLEGKHESASIEGAWPAGNLYLSLNG